MDGPGFAGEPRGVLTGDQPGKHRAGDTLVMRYESVPAKTPLTPVVERTIPAGSASMLRHRSLAGVKDGQVVRRHDQNVHE